MYNLAGLDENIASSHCHVELSKAGIAAFEMETAQSGEVASRVYGKLYFPAVGAIVTFNRYWYYWVVRLSLPLPYEAALALNSKWSAQARVEGYAGGKEPGAGGVSSYHVDTAEALAALKDALCGAFGETIHLPGPHPQIEQASVSDEILGLLRLSKTMERNENLADRLLIEAMNLAETSCPSLTQQVLDELVAYYQRRLQILSRRRAYNKKCKDESEYHRALMDTDDVLSKLELLRRHCQGKPALVSRRRQLLRLWRNIEKYLQAEVTEERHSAATAKEDWKQKLSAFRVGLNLLWLYRIRKGLKKAADSQLEEARQILLHFIDYDREAVTRLPEDPGWNRYQGQLASRLHRANAYCYQG